MKMGAIEKRFVNSPGHSDEVAAAAARRLRGLPSRPGQCYLDVGCGNGTAAIHLSANLGLDVTGIDVDPEQIHLARQAAAGIRGVRFVTASATRLPLEDGTFDYAATNKTTHHVPEWGQALAEMLRVLRPGGYLIYADFVLPRWLATLLRPIVGQRAGLVTRDALDHIFGGRGLEVVRPAGPGALYEAVLRKRVE
jgi:ubiquinone/menaquinone biosynthesis C-methylase UbiE